MKVIGYRRLRWGEASSGLCCLLWIHWLTLVDTFFSCYKGMGLLAPEAKTASPLTSMVAGYLNITNWQKTSVGHVSLVLNFSILVERRRSQSDTDWPWKTCVDTCNPCENICTGFTFCLLGIEKSLLFSSTSMKRYVSHKIDHVYAYKYWYENDFSLFFQDLENAHFYQALLAQDSVLCKLCVKVL